MSDETEYNGGYKRVWGVPFKQPDSDNHGLNDESTTDDWFNVLLIVLIGAVPAFGTAFALAAMFTGLVHRHRNPYCLDENYWKAGVLSMVMQVLSLSMILFFGV